ncbi:MAG TPA: hypothetical protein VIF57_04150, partial [Polyangia bacterium]
MSARAFAVAAVVCALMARRASAQIPEPAPQPSADAGAPSAAPAPVPPPPAVAPAPPAPTDVAGRTPPDQAMLLAPEDVMVRPAPDPWGATSSSMFARWQSKLYGFVEMNAMHDGTQSYGPSANNNILARPGTYAGL